MGNKCLRETWREAHPDLKWTPEFKSHLIAEITKISTSISVTPCLLFAGPTAAGKSSLVNTFLSAGKDQIVRKAKVGTDDKSLTLKYTRYDSVGRLQHIYRMCDTMGILSESEKGLKDEDLLSVIHGHIAPGYKFDETKAIQSTDVKYIRNPSETEKSHCLLVVISSEDLKTYQKDYIEKVKNAIRISREEDIPAFIILTKVDKICDTVRKDHRSIFKCQHVKGAVRDAGESFGLAEGYIFPVINYSSQVTNSGEDAIEIVALLTLNYLFQSISDFFEGTEIIKKETAK